MTDKQNLKFVVSCFFISMSMILYSADVKSFHADVIVSFVASIFLYSGMYLFYKVCTWPTPQNLQKRMEDFLDKKLPK